VALVETQESQRLRRDELAAALQPLAEPLLRAGLIKPAAGSKAGVSFTTTCIGPKTAASVLAFFAAPGGQALLGRLHKLGITPRGSPPRDPVSAATPAPSGPLAGMTFVLTGTLQSMKRDEARDHIRRLGGAAAESVSRNTTYLVAGSDTGARKTERAAELGVKVLDEARFLELLRTAEAPTGGAGTVPPPAAPPPPSVAQPKLPL